MKVSVFFQDTTDFHSIGEFYSAPSESNLRKTKGNRPTHTEKWQD